MTSEPFDTEPPQTEPAVTEPAVSEPVETEPPVSEPAVTEPAPSTTAPPAEGGQVTRQMTYDELAARWVERNPTYPLAAPEENPFTGVMDALAVPVAAEASMFWDGLSSTGFPTPDAAFKGWTTTRETQVENVRWAILEKDDGQLIAIFIVSDPFTNPDGFVAATSAALTNTVWVLGDSADQTELDASLEGFEPGAYFEVADTFARLTLGAAALALVGFIRPLDL